MNAPSPDSTQRWVRNRRRVPLLAILWVVSGHSLLAGSAPEQHRSTEAAAPVPSEREATQPFELYFEAKLLFRDRVMMQRVAVDQWAGGKLLMRARPLGPGTIFELDHPIEDPWTFRWYPTKNEVKLGAAVAVPEPSGHPYGALADPLTREAERRYALWWEDDRVEPTATRQPDWKRRSENFWAAQHAKESDSKDPLHEYPVFPFHVLGDPTGRFGFVVGTDGGIVEDSITEKMSSPWLEDGWQAWQRGEQAAGYGYWDTERPGWEPHTYQAFASAMALMAWSPFKSGNPAATLALEPGAGYSITAQDLASLFATFFETLNPRFANRIDWSGSPTLRFEIADKTATSLTLIGDCEDTPSGKVRYSAWRYARYDVGSKRLQHDEIQILANHRNDGIKAWIKVGYRPVEQDNK